MEPCSTASLYQWRAQYCQPLPTLNCLLHNSHHMDFGDTSTSHQMTLNTTGATVTCRWSQATPPLITIIPVNIYVRCDHHSEMSLPCYQRSNWRILASTISSAIVSMLGLRCASYYDGRTNENADDAQKEIHYTFNKLLILLHFLIFLQLIETIYCIKTPLATLIISQIYVWHGLAHLYLETQKRDQRRPATGSTIGKFYRVYTLSTPLILRTHMLLWVK